MITVACVLKSGGDFDVEHVAALRDAVARHIGRPHRFVCLSDVPVPCDRIILQHNWPGFFSKMELFNRERLPGEVLFLDLDTLIVGPFGDMLTGQRFTALRDWMLPGINSSLMAWSDDLSAIYERFRAAPAEWMAKAQTPGCWVDQGLIGLFTPVEIGFWQDSHPGRVVSYKVNHVDERGLPPGASIVCFHGRPRPWETSLWRL